MTQRMPAAGRAGAQRVKVLTIAAGHLVHDIYTGFLAPVLPLLIEKFALSYAAAGFLSVLLRLPSIASPAVGAWADSRGARYIVIASPALTAAAMCLMGAAQGYAGLALLAVVAGASSTCFHVPSPVLLKKVAGSRPGAAMSFFQVGGELSRAIAPLVVLGAVAWWTLAGIYRLIPLGAATSLVLYWALRDTAVAHVPAARPRDRAGILQVCAGERSFFAALFGMLVCKSCVASVVAAYLPVYLTAQGKSLWAAGGALSLLQAAAIGGVFCTGILSDKVGCARMLQCLTLATPACMVLFLCSSGWLLAASLALLGLTAFSSTPVILSLIQKRCTAFPATANGVYMMISFMLGSLTVLAAGMLSDAIGIKAAFWICAAGSLLGLPFLLFLDGDRQR